MTLTLVHDRAERVGVMLLAREVGARLDGSERDIPVIPLYICLLLDELSWGGLTEAPQELKHPIRPIATTFAWAFRQHILDRSTLINQAKDFQRLIRRIDDDDGWPTDRWLNALVGCCIAMELSLKDPEHIRWPAEAGNDVATLKMGIRTFDSDSLAQRRSWVCARLLKARQLTRTYSTP